jgi:ubiquitin C-terminal hydrolase
MVSRRKQWYIIDDNLVEARQMRETELYSDVYMLFYSKSGTVFNSRVIKRTIDPKP